MKPELAINQRIREIMAFFGFSENVAGFYKKFIAEEENEPSEKLRTVFKDLNPIKLDFLLEITGKIGERAGKIVNGHWLLTGEGQMFVEENSTLATKNPDLKKQMEDTISYLRQENTKLLNIVELALKRGGTDGA